MSILDRSSLEESPLADLHLIASELSMDGYRRLRKAALIDAILERQESAADATPLDEDGGAEDEAVLGVADLPTGDDVVPAEDDVVPAEAHVSREERDETAPRRRRGRRGGRGRAASREEPESEGEAPAPERGRERAPERERERAPEPERERGHEPSVEETVVEGVVELLPNGSGFLRVSSPEPSDDDVYISAAQLKRCELIAGDHIAGPRRSPRRSERFPSLVRIDMINGRPATEIAEGPRFDDLPATFPEERFRLGSDDPTVKAIEWLTPFGKGSRVTIAGASRAGKTEALRRLAAALGDHDDLQLLVALAGVRPEEISTWPQGPLEPAGSASFAASGDAQAHAVEHVLDQGRRLAARGADVVALIDTLDGLEPLAARKALAAARNLLDSGSLTVIATSRTPIGGETTVIALDVALASTGRFPALDLVNSGTIRPELLVGDAGAEAIARARAEAIDA